MGLFSNDAPAGRRFLMKERAFDIGEDYWVEDDAGNRAYHVDGKALRMRKTFVLKDATGAEVAVLKGKLVSVRDKMTIERHGRTATVSKALFGIRERYKINMEDGPDLGARGNFTDHDYEIEQEGRIVGRVSKKWFRMRDSYGVEVRDGADAALIVAIAVCLDEMAHD